MTSSVPATLPQAFFLATDAGQRFCLFYPPQGTPLGRILYLHPFAEELNSTRRMVATQARALAQAGYGVLQIDMLGCGDSAGDFADATWEAWLHDARQAHCWLDNHTSGPLWLWGTRSGALLAAQLAELLQQSRDEPTQLLFWQPVGSGQHMLQQFLRLRAASQWLGMGNAAEPPPSRALAQGQTVDIAGYRLSPLLAQGLTDARMPQPTSLQPGRLVWLEVSPAPSPALSPTADKQLATWIAAGWQVQAQAVEGPPFWQTVGISESPALVQATLEALARPAQS